MNLQTQDIPGRLAEIPSHTARILVVDGEPDSQALLEFLLLRENYDVSIVGRGEEALNQALQRTPSLVVVDIVLPGLNGLKVCQNFRADKRLAQIPILILSEKAAEADKVLGFESGADDYVAKPFGPRELVCRIRRLLRTNRAAEAKNELVKSTGLELDASRHQATADGKPVRLTATEFKLLEFLIKRRGRVQTRERLLQDVWEYEKSLCTRTVDTHMRRLRMKLGPPGRYLETVRGVGYRFLEV
jgi:two-component system phosphate regulon response regulator PhoB